MTKKIMTKKAVPRRDAFTHSLGGMTTIASFAMAPAVAHDQLHQIRDEQCNHETKDNSQKPGPWFRWPRQHA